MAVDFDLGLFILICVVTEDGVYSVDKVVEHNEIYLVPENLK